MKKSICSIITCILLFHISLSNAKNSAFKVCADPVNPPVSNKNGKGFENEIAQLLAEKRGQTVEYTWFPQRIGFIRNTLKAYKPDTEEFKCDVVMGVPTGYELTSTTKPYYRSTYVLIYPKNKGWDNIKTAEDIMQHQATKQRTIRIAMFDRGPGTTWIKNHGLIDQGIPYQTMTGDDTLNTSMMMDQEFAKNKVDMAILWGPTAAYIYSVHPDQFVMIPMQSSPGLRYDFPMSIGVRRKDKQLLNELNQLIDENKPEITSILRSHNIPLINDKGQLISQ
ncbi:MAG: quinoprotein dehydrogenase-associated putative ABC transporter substrate-binding protein [Gammaproteobacteria bacterium]|nr:quinoprotein dehydrogenase-associated putative ABC transporter substrate-binding protein [Gammaproteobacteria bacterium]